MHSPQNRYLSKGEKMKIKNYLLLLGCTVLLLSCAAGPDTLVVMTHDSFAISEPVIAAFEQSHNVQVTFLPSGDAGSTLNRAILSKDAPVADVLFGVDNTFLSRALEEKLFLPYAPAALSQIIAEIPLVPGKQMVPVDYGDVCINYDKSYFAEQGLALPQTLDDLLDPSYKGLLVVENPATSSPGLAFLLATIAEYGPEGFLNFWKALKENGLVVVNDWETAYYTNFSGSAGQGPQPMVVSYATSPAAEVIFAEEELDASPTASLVGPNMCFRQIEYAGILKGTQKLELAQAFIDHMLSPVFQSDIPLNMFVYPVIQGAEIPQEFIDHAQIPQKPAVLEAELIAQYRESWIAAWRELFTN